VKMFWGEWSDAAERRAVRIVCVAFTCYVLYHVVMAVGRAYCGR
jgi:hypothetical protein